ncbi:MAG: 2-oxo acid dehydrogenase subunit E2 [Flavobacteriales bacterium]|nr:2-oxo acid dehydrogenase subunit E2 [Flavobacteriales bacterium]MDG1219781.1 dihydrolipoamide acetyltransferase family protein [Schleiferiaceae bacterium]MDO7593143.1 2-oxo acid dehydrogenase subunit E2 [Schleiferiaceae bacterium]
MFELIMPKMGESVAEATITEWLKAEGDTIDADESLLTIATDKVDSDLPSPVSGVLIKQLFSADEVIQVGQVIAHIQEAGDTSSPTTPVETKVETASPPAATATASTLTDSKPQTAVVNEPEATASGTPSSKPTNIPRESNGRFYSPLVRNIASEEGLSLSELDGIQGSGQDGRVTKKDLMTHLSQRGSAPAAIAKTSKPSVALANQSPAFASTHQVLPVPVMEGDEIIEMDRMRKLIANHMVMSTHVSPHVTSFVEADVTVIVNWRNRVKDDFQKRDGTKITFTPIFMEAVVRAIKDFPMVNVGVDGDNIIVHKAINLGMATALPSGNLIVPVIKNADRFSLSGLAKEVNELAAKARNNKLSPDDVANGTYTVTNVGTFGNVMGTPIINQPQVAILALGAVRKIPAVIETPEGDMIGIRHKMFLSHSYDHRVVDGALGGMFVKRVADYLEQFDPNRVI